MGLQSVFAEIHPDWYRRIEVEGAAGTVAGDLLLQQARHSALGRRMLARWLMAEVDGDLFAPRPDGSIGNTVVRWPRARLASLLRDLGALAFAPAIRAEVRREPVRQLKRALENSYLLALDKQVWDGKVEPAVTRRLQVELTQVLVPEAGDDGVHALLDRHGRGELHAWATQRDPALAEWMVLQYPPEDRVEAHLPEKQVVFLHDHHLARVRTS
jgi:hypothetical protein